MIRLRIDHREISVEQGTTLLAAARRLGIDIPTMCYLEEAGLFTSCMICLVREERTGRLVPSCSALAEEGMEITTFDEEIAKARKTALELLLSDHTGDCDAPCQISCPAHMNIPLMNRLLARGKTSRALEVVLEHIPLPGVLGRICPAPCEGACRRKSADEPVSICLLKRYAGDAGRYPGIRPLPAGGTAPKKIAVIGSGPAGLSAGYYLSLAGHRVVMYDRNEMPGGMLRYGVPEEKLPHRVLDREIAFILGDRIGMKAGFPVDRDSFEQLRAEYDATLVATGEIDREVGSWGLATGPKGLQVDKSTYRTSMENVFAIGNVLRPSRMAVRSVGQGKEVAGSIGRYLSGEQATGPHGTFNSRFGRLSDTEITQYLKESVPGNRVNPAGGPDDGFSSGEVIREALRCLHCDCRDRQSCKLRLLSDRYQANQKHYLYGGRKQVTKKWVHDRVIYEPAKCIKCGICVRLAEKYREKYGFTFIGRGFDVQIGIPFDQDLRGSLAETAEKIARSCPTGALAIANDNK